MNSTDFKDSIKARTEDSKRGASLENLNIAYDKVNDALEKISIEFVDFALDNDTKENTDILAEYVDSIEKLEKIKVKLGEMISKKTWI